MGGGTKMTVFESSPEVLNWLNDLMVRHPALEVCRVSIYSAFTILRNALLSDGKVLTCGNGGSAADAEHISGELMKGFIKKRSLSGKMRERFIKVCPDCEPWVDHLQQPLPVYPLAMNGPLASAIANDLGLDLIFAQQVLGYGNRGDVLFALSTSGNSPNILKAIRVARFKEMTVIGLTGGNGGRFMEDCDLVVKVPAARVFEIQELHLPVYHCICAMLESFFFPES
jgi:D-sedoheptulose 7-phosphate isomerase